MKIAMLARNPNLYSHKRLKEAAEQRGHELDIIDTLRCFMNIASRRPVTPRQRVRAKAPGRERLPALLKETGHGREDEGTLHPGR